MSRMAFLTRVLAFSHVVPPSLSSAAARAAGVLLNEIEPLERDEQLVVAGVAELHELLRAPGPAPTAELLQADEPADAVVDVDDEIADLEVAEVGQERASRRRRRSCDAAFLFEQIGLGEQPQLRRRADGSRARAGRS